jgi:hypothetical protein
MQQKTETNTPKIISEGLLGISSLIGLHAARAEYSNLFLNAAEIFTKLISFADLTDISYSNKSFIGAAGIAIGTIVDDVMIDQGFYKQHHLSKVSCALYAGYKISENTEITQKIASVPELKNDYMSSTSMLFGAGLLGLSTLLRSGDIINAMRAGTKECIEFSDKVSELTSVDPFIDMQVGASVNTVIGGARQFAVENKLEIGSPLSDAVKAAISTSVNVLSASKSKSEFKKQLVERFASVDERTMHSLESDTRAYKTMQNIVDNIEKASNGITNNAVNYGIKNSWQQVLAGQSGDSGLSAFVAANLFNNFKEKKAKHKKIVTKSEDLFSIKSQLNDYDKKNSYSTTDEVIGCVKKIYDVLTKPFAASFLVSAMQCSKDFDTPATFSKYFTPITSTLGMSISIECHNSSEALDDLMYLANKIDEIHHNYY